MSRAVLVFTGYNQRAVVAFLRTLQSHAVDYAIIASSESDPIFVTAYANKVAAIRSVRELDLDDIAEKIDLAKGRLRADSYMIAPSTEALNRFVLQFRRKFIDLGCEIPLVKFDDYKKISDKYSFQALCRGHGIQVPEEFAGLANAKLPCIAKPKEYVSTNGSIYSPVFITSESERRDFARDHNPDDFYFQEFVGGESIYLLYYFYSDGEVAKFSQKNYVQLPGGRSIIAAMSSGFHEGSESEKYESLFKAAGFFGLVMVEVKCWNGNVYMIEANPRFWGPSQLFVDAGLNLFEDFLFDAGLIRTKPVHRLSYGPARYFWFGGTVSSVVEGESLSYHDYTNERYAGDLPSWIMADVYNRDDTRKLFEREIRI